MKRFLLRIIICLVPTLASIAVVGWAYNEYQSGRGGFVLGVDLVGGTILIYEVDESKMTAEARSGFKVQDLAEALKRRIDPDDLKNVTVRPTGGGSPERVEIILPTGGKHQADIERRNWQGVLSEAKRKFDLPEPLETRQGDKGQLVEDVSKVKEAEVLAWVKDQRKDKKVDWNDLVRAAERKFLPDLKESLPTTAGTDEDLARRVVVAMRPQISGWVDDRTEQGGRSKKMFTGDEVENIKGLIARQGKLEFRILANSLDDGAAMEAASLYFAPLSNDPLTKGRDPSLAPARREELTRLVQKNEPPPGPRGPDNASTFAVKIGSDESRHTYSWVEIGKNHLYSMGFNTEALEKDAGNRSLVQKGVESQQPFTRPLGDNPNNRCMVWVRSIPPSEWARRSPKDRQLGKEREFFVLVRDPVEGKKITGDYLVKAEQSRDEQGRPAISFTFNSEGGSLFYDVTSRNKPGDGIHRHLAIILDGLIESAPSLRSPIRTQGQITGNYKQQEVDEMLRILRAGALPATLKKKPVSENSTGATLGADTVFWGFWSVIGAFVAVMVFMVFYYRFAGLVACVALLANLLLTVAFMVLVQAAFTLPGLAGLVLMLGMAVDANVLIYERLREERERGANLTLALRNGYDRAFPTILDTHLSSIFTAIVLYVVGNDQLRGFGISLTVGLIISLFTSLYMTRTIFEIWLFKGWMKDLNFFEGLVKLIHARYWDFMSIRQYWFAATLILTILGAILFVYRADSNPREGKATVLNIDFTGGTAYAGRMNQAVTPEELRKKLDDKDHPLPDLTILPLHTAGETAEPGKYFVFDIRTSERNSEEVLAFISRKLGRGDDGAGLLVTLHLQRFALEPGKAGATGARLAFSDEKDKVDFASQAQVQRLLSNAFLARNRSPSSFSVERPDRKVLTWEMTLSAAALAFPPQAAEAKAKPYAEVPADDGKALAAALVEANVKPRVAEWFADSAATNKAANQKEWEGLTAQALTKAEGWFAEQTKGKLAWNDLVGRVVATYPAPDAGYEKVKEGDTAGLKKLVEAGERARIDRLWADFAGRTAKRFPATAENSYAGLKFGQVDELKKAAEASEKANAEEWVKVVTAGATTPNDKDGERAMRKGDRAIEKGDRYAQLMLRLSEPMEPSELRSILSSVQGEFERSPQPERLEVFDRQLAANTQQRALYAILASWGAILLYLWFRFGSWTFGAAAVCCLIHDLFFTLGIIAACHYLHAWLPGVAWFLRIEDFKIDLVAVAALLTLVGYSVNDTIVVFDRIREVRGKNPLLTPQMINDSVNQTLTRTILASTTVLVVVLVLYFLGGPVLRLFAFVMIVGVVVGTYSSIYIASPLLLIFGEGRAATPTGTTDRPPPVAAGPRLQSGKGGEETGIKKG